MKRALLIAGGTVGGLGAVLSITPPQLGSNGISALAGASAATSLPGTQSNNQNSAAAVTTATPAAKQSAAALATKKATATATKKATSGSSSTSSSSTNSNSSATNNSATSSATPSAPATKAAASSVSGSFTGDAINVGYGMVQVKIVVSNGKITEASAVQAPSGRSQRFTDYAVPNLRQQTLSANSAAINGVSGASYTSYGWYKSLISALQKAGMPTGA
jgi:uncharacterized protein with FMN-binding domain